MELQNIIAVALLFTLAFAQAIEMHFRKITQYNPMINLNFSLQFFVEGYLFPTVLEYSNRRSIALQLISNIFTSVYYVLELQMDQCWFM